MHLCCSIALLAALLPAAAFAQIGTQPNTFELHINGKKIGKDVYTFAATKHGYKTMSHTEGSIHANDFDYKYTFTFDENYGYVDGARIGQDTNQQDSWLPSKDRKEMTVAASAEGRTSSTFEPVGPDLVVLPAFEAGAAQALLLLATTHPAPKDTYSVYLTSGYGAAGGSAPNPNAQPNPDETLPPGQHCFTALWVKGTPFTGTLDGKPLNINSFMLAFGKFRWIFFADEQNNLMQVNVSLLHASYIRENFKLDPPKPLMPR